MLAQVAASQAYREAGQVLAIVLEQNWEADAIREKAVSIERALDKATVVGITHYDGLVQTDGVQRNTTLSLFYFKERAATVRRISMKGRSEE